MKITLSLVFLVMVLLLAMVGCIPRVAIDCNQIEDITLRELDFDQQNLNEFTEWIENTYQIKSSDILSGSYQNQANLTPLTNSIGWAFNNKLYRAHFLEDQLVRITVEWEGALPDIEEVQECLGVPESYVASYQRGGNINELQLDLWYPTEGLVVRSGISSRSDNPPSNLEASGVYRIIYTDNGDINYVVQSALIDSSEAKKSHLLELLKPWPERWKDIIVEDTIP
jgi:hypothetical protein